MELKDPLSDRPVKSLQMPMHQKMSHNKLFDGNNNIIISENDIINFFLKEGRLEKESIITICKLVMRLLAEEPNLLFLYDPIVVIGDIHGQYNDLPTILNLAGNLKNTKYLFLGDYVDRGNLGCEVIFTLYLFKIMYPNSIFLLRGNHECRELTTFFNFKQEVLYKYDEEVFNYIMDTFDHLPLAAIINSKFIALHGGLSPELYQAIDINKINRFIEPPKAGLLCDTLWADPIEDPYGTIRGGSFAINDARGCSYFFGAEASSSFLNRNDLLIVIRAHEAQIDGFKAHIWNGNSNFPDVLTIFSAPNYCGCYGNKGAIINIVNNNMDIVQYNFVESPYFLPNFSNIFSWSMPFVCEKSFIISLPIII